jgi:hypothetical protein
MMRKKKTLNLKEDKTRRVNKRKEEQKSPFKLFIELILSFLMIPVHIIKALFYVFKAAKEKTAEISVNKKRESVKAVYSEFAVIKTENGDFNKFEEKIISSDSKIGIILGARGSGKSALGIKLLENLYSKSKKNCVAMGFHAEVLPSFIASCDNISQIKNNSYVLIDEGGVLFSSRDSMSNANKLLSDLILVARHKSLSILFISQNSSNLDVNILRQADYLLLKPSSLLQMDFERKKIKEIYVETAKEFEKYKETKGLTYIYSDDFRGFITNPLPTFWKEGLSKSFK